MPIAIYYFIYNLHKCQSDTEYEYPEYFWIRLYSVDESGKLGGNKSCLSKISEIHVPQSIHGELSDLGFEFLSELRT